MENDFEQELKQMLWGRGIYYFGPMRLEADVDKRWGPDDKDHHFPHYPQQPVHNPHKIGKRNLITALRALARENPSAKIPSWIDMNKMNISQVSAIFEREFGMSAQDARDILQDGSRGQGQNWTLSSAPVQQLLRARRKAR